MTACDLEEVLSDVAASARRAGDRALASKDVPILESGAVLEALTGARMDRRLVQRVGPELAVTVNLSKAVVVLCSMLGARHGMTIDMAGVLDDLGAPGGDEDERAIRTCLRCRKPFESDHRGNRICDPCAPKQAAAERVFAPVHFAEPARVEGV